MDNNNKLKERDLNNSHYVTATGCETFSAVLQNPDTALEKVNLGYNRINDNFSSTFVGQQQQA